MSELVRKDSEHKERIDEENIEENDRQSIKKLKVAVNRLDLAQKIIEGRIVSIESNVKGIRDQNEAEAELKAAW